MLLLHLCYLYILVTSNLILSGDDTAVIPKAHVTHQDYDRA